jgi:hypothetical protein
VKIFAQRSVNAALLTGSKDDRSHERLKRRKRDRFLNEVLLSTHVPLVRVRAAARYQPELIWRRLVDKVGAM